MLLKCLGAMVIAVPLLAGIPAVRAEAESRAAPSVAAPAPAAAAAERGAPRLRFRSKGPTCMCLDGLSEAEIEAAERARRQPADGLPAIIQKP